MAEEASQLKPGVLTNQEILEACGLGGNSFPETFYQGLIQPCRRENVRSASYDLRVGSEYHFTGPEDRSGVSGMSVARLEVATNEHIVIPPNQVAVISSMEKVCLPRDIVGHLSLKQDILLQGLIMGSQSQIDAGYRGWIYPLLYNLTDMEVNLQLGQPVIRLELVRLAQLTARAYDGDYQDATLAKSLKRPIGSSLAALHEDVRKRGEEIDAQRRRTTTTAVIATFAAVAVSIAIAFVTGFVGEVWDAKAGASKAEGQVEQSVKLDGKVTRLESEVEKLKCQVIAQQPGGNDPRTQKLLGANDC